MDNRAIVKVATLPLYWHELSYLSEDEKAALGLVSLAANEVNVLTRLNLLQLREVVDDTIVDQGYWIQRSVILRIWSAKLYEFKIFIDNLCSGKTKCASKAVIDLAAKAQKAFTGAEKHSGYEIARESRNEITNHYELNPLRKNIKHLDPKSDVSICLHDIRCNSFSRLGEAVGLVGLLLRKTSSTNDVAEKAAAFESWLDWNLLASDWIDGVELDFYEEFVFKHFPDRSAIEKAYYVDPRLVGEPTKDLIPMFLRGQDK
ncbi:MAG: hypothetical protein KGZ77_04225 [Rhodobacteraceae bacterium]|nr:hypothetical protein [Paracoccaceae bacterium]